MNPLKPDQAPVPGLDALARERQPERELWAGIAARITPLQAGRRGASPVWPFALAASVCLAVLVGVLVRQQPVSSGPESALQAAVTAPEAAASQHRTAYDNYPYSNRDGQGSAAALSPRTLRMLRSESLDNAPALVAEHAQASGLMKATYAAGSGRGAHSQRAILPSQCRR